MKRHFTVTVNGQKFDVAVVEKDSTGSVVERTQPVAAPAPAPAKAPVVNKVAETPKAAAPSGKGISSKAPMAGKIISLLVKEGDVIKRGQPLLVLEAMKLENDIVAPQDGTVTKVLVTVGQAVETGDELVSIA